jgi:hypothetical protein
MTKGVSDIDTNRFIRDTYLYCQFSGQNNNDYVPEFRPVSKWFPDRVPSEFKARISLFTNNLKSSIKPHPLTSNLLPTQLAGLNFLKSRPDLHVWESDKNLGPVLSTKLLYIQRAFDDHLNDATTYLPLSEEDASSGIDWIKKEVKLFVTKHHSRTETRYGKSQTVITNCGRYLLQSLEVDDPFAYFYLLAKIHKSPWSTRPITSVPGSILYGLGKWVDRELQKVINHISYKCTNSRDVVTTLRDLILQPGTKLATADAQSMYTNIDTRHALLVISNYLHSDEFTQQQQQYSLNINASALMDGLNLVMNNSIMKFNNSYFQQLTGTAMGTPPAPPYATLYFYLHEKEVLPRYNQYLEYYNRYIDDAILLWKTHLPGADTAWTQLQTDFDAFGKLRWDFSSLSESVVFLDLRISLSPNKDRIITTLYEKDLNLYLYIPPNSLHPPGGLRSFIIGNTKRIMERCSDPSEILPNLRNMKLRLVHRGYDARNVDTLIRQTLLNENYNNNNNIIDPTQQQPEPEPKLIFLHKIYYPSPANQSIRKLIRDSIISPPKEPHLAMLKNSDGIRLDPFRFIIANHRLRNLRDKLCPRKFSYHPELDDDPDNNKNKN